MFWASLSHLSQLKIIKIKEMTFTTIPPWSKLMLPTGQNSIYVNNLHVFLLIFSYLLFAQSTTTYILGEIIRGYWKQNREKMLSMSILKYSKHWPYAVAHTIDCVCSTMLNHGLNHGLFLSLFKLIPCPIHWIVCMCVSLFKFQIWILKQF